MTVEEGTQKKMTASPLQRCLQFSMAKSFSRRPYHLVWVSQLPTRHFVFYHNKDRTRQTMVVPGDHKRHLVCVSVNHCLLLSLLQCSSLDYKQCLVQKGKFQVSNRRIPPNSRRMRFRCSQPYDRILFSSQLSSPRSSSARMWNQLHLPLKRN